MAKKKPLEEEQAGEAVPEIEESAPPGEAAPAAPELRAPEEWAVAKGHTNPPTGGLRRGIAHMRAWIFEAAKAHAGWGTDRCPLQAVEIRNEAGELVGHRHAVLVTEAQYDAAVDEACNGIGCGGQ